MELTNDFEVGVPIDQAWALLTDLERIAPCMPGAKLQEVEGDEYRGLVKVKVGPITAEYKGTARFVDKNESEHKAVLDASGRDTRGQGNANATITATLEEQNGRTQVHLVTDLNITGKVAQFGRGVMVDVSAKLLKQFVGNLETMVLASDDATPGEAAAEPASEEQVVDAVKQAQSAKKAVKKAAKKTTKKAAKKTTKKAAAKKAPDEGEAAVAAAPVADEPAGATEALRPTEEPRMAEASDAIPPTRPAEETESATVSGNGADPGHQSSGPGDAATAAPTVRKIDSPDPEPVDLMDAAGSSVAKRVLPIVAVVVVVFVMVRLLRRRRQRKQG